MTVKNELGAAADCSANRPGRERDRIETAWVPRAALGETASGEDQADQKPMLLQRFTGVVRAAGSKPTAAIGGDYNERRGDSSLINPDQTAQQAAWKRKHPPQQ